MTLLAYGNRGSSADDVNIITVNMNVAFVPVWYWLVTDGRTDRDRPTRTLQLGCDDDLAKMMMKWTGIIIRKCAVSV